MSASKTIPRKKRQPAPDSFDNLRREAVAFVQQLSGDLWTDYNLHDPGVTILEALCYAVTDLIYRTGFPVQDLLASSDGTLDTRKLSLHLPQDVFPCRPTTVMDMRKGILDAVQSLSDVRLRELGSGLYSVDVRLDAGAAGLEAASVVPSAVKKAVRKAFDSLRNLGEDLEDVNVVPETHYELFADIEIKNGVEPAEVLAQIYYYCAQRVADGVSVVSYEEALTAGGSLEDLFDGPATQRGVLRPSSLPQAGDSCAADLFSLVQTIDGVAAIRKLELRRSVSSPALDETHGSWPTLKVPERPAECHVLVYKGNGEIPVSLSAVRAGYNKLRFRESSLRRQGKGPGAFLPQPTGEPREFSSYSSVQQDLPGIFGVGRFGIPASEGPVRHAQALQLKAYLLLFEQLMANFLAQLGATRELFSLGGRQLSYATQPLDSSVVPGADEVYTDEGIDGAASSIWQEGFDKFKYPDRKGRLLDYQLALFGDGLGSLRGRQFDAFHGHDEVEDSSLRIKSSLLEKIVDVSRDRAAGFKVMDPSWNSLNVSGLAQRISLLLGIRDVQARSLSAEFKNRGLHITTAAEVYVRTDGDASEPERLSSSSDLRGEFPSSQSSARSPEGSALFLKGHFDTNLLRYGGERRRYGIFRESPGSERHRVLLDVSLSNEWGGKWVHVGDAGSRAEALEVASALHRLVNALNSASEGLHVVEHILLRPSDFSSSPQYAAKRFFPFRLSVVFPSWPARFQDREFRSLAEETIQQNCPAHIYPVVHWLDFDEMKKFEARYSRWLTRLARPKASKQSVHRAASSVARFLQGREGGL